MKPIQIAQIGIGHNHAEAAMSTMRCFPAYFEVVGVAEDDPYWYNQRKDREPYRGMQFVSEAELLATPGLEAVCVEKDVPDNEAMALQCAKMGLHIRMDKPGGENHAMFKRIVELQRSNHKAFQMRLGIGADRKRQFDTGSMIENVFSYGFTYGFYD